MKKQKTTITIVGDNNRYCYRDNSIDEEDKTMVEVFGLMISRLAASVQYDADFEHNVEYTIDITKRIM